MLLPRPDQIAEYTQRGFWGHETLIDLFLRNAHQTPDAVALVDPANRAELTAGAFTRWTYAELLTVVDRFASGLAPTRHRQR